MKKVCVLACLLQSAMCYPRTLQSAGLASDSSSAVCTTGQFGPTALLARVKIIRQGHSVSISSLSSEKENWIEKAKFESTMEPCNAAIDQVGNGVVCVDDKFVSVETGEAFGEQGKTRGIKYAKADCEFME